MALPGTFGAVLVFRSIVLLKYFLFQKRRCSRIAEKALFFRLVVRMSALAAKEQFP